jgi:hypothetical protein
MESDGILMQCCGLLGFQLVSTYGLGLGFEAQSSAVFCLQVELVLTSEGLVSFHQPLIPSGFT